MSLADFVHLEGYKVSETYKHLDAGYVLIAVESAESEMVCKRCNTRLEGQHGKHRLKAKYKLAEKNLKKDYDGERNPRL